MSEEKLKPCPFCGRDAEIVKLFKRYRVGCPSNDCFVRPMSPNTGDVGDVNIAIRCWNKRN